MSGIDVGIVELLYKLLPGLMAAAVFHSITPFPKRDIFDRVVNALIFTAVGQLAVAGAKPVVFFLGERVYSFGKWSDDSDLFVASVGAVLSSVLLALLLNNDWLHNLLRICGVTKRIALPSPWYSAHARFERYVTLTLKDGRRAFGWPKEWPDSPNSGHYVLLEFEWLLDDGSSVEAHDVEAFVLSAGDVEYVEFMRFADDPIVIENKAQIVENHSKLESLSKLKGGCDEQ